MTGVGRRIASGAGWMVLLTGLQRVLGVVSTIILARLLLPEDFGLIAMAMAFVAIMELIWAFSFDAALIQNQAADRRHYDTAWTLNMAFGAVVAIALAAAAYPAALFYDEPRLTELVMWLAVGSLFRGLENIGVVSFRKELRFGAEFWYQISSKLSGFLVTIPLAFVLRSYWALAIGMVASRVVTVLISYLAHPYRPRFCLAARSALLGFSKWLFLNNVLFAVQMRSQDFVIGKLGGATGLGLYNISYEIATLPSTTIVYPINRAVFPGLARLVDDPLQLARTYLQTVAVIALLVVPAGMGIAATAPLLVPTVLGSKWIETVPVVEVLAFFGVLAALSSVFGPTFLALGRPRVLSALSVGNVLLFIPALIVGTRSAGVLGAAFASLSVVATMAVVSHWLAARALGIGIGRLLAHLWRPAAASTAMFVLVRSLLAGAESTLPVLPGGVLLVAAVGLGVAVYGTALFGLWVLSGRAEGAESVLQTESNRLLAELARRWAATRRP